MPYEVNASSSTALNTFPLVGNSCGMGPLAPIRQVNRANTVAPIRTACGCRCVSVSWSLSFERVYFDIYSFLWNKHFLCFILMNCLVRLAFAPHGVLLSYCAHYQWQQSGIRYNPPAHCRADYWTLIECQYSPCAFCNPLVWSSYLFTLIFFSVCDLQYKNIVCIFCIY